MKTLQRICSLILALSLMTSCVYAVDYGADIDPNEPQYEQKFSDVPTGHWAFSYITELVDRGAINGYPDGMFRPKKLVSREEFAKIMVVAAGLTPTTVSQSSFVDVPVSYWASPFIETAKPYMTAYKNGSQYQFKPSTGALREDIAVAVVKLKGYDTRLADLSMLRAMFSDVDSISAGAQPYVALAVENGLISGYPDGTFRAQGTVTRAEAAAVLWRAFQYGNDTKVPADEIPDPEKPEDPVKPEDPTTPEVPDRPEEPTTPEEPNRPEAPQYEYTLDTVAYNVSDYDIDHCSMVLTNDGDIYFIHGQTLYATNSDAELFVGYQTKDLSYPLIRDDKNKNFGLTEFALAYDSKNDIVYLLGNEFWGSKRMALYDVTDLSDPVCLIAAELQGGLDFTVGLPQVYRGVWNYYEIPVLSNGSILIPTDEFSGHEQGACMVSPARGTISYWGSLSARFVVGSQVVKMDYDSMTVAPLTAPNAGTTVSLEGNSPLRHNECAGPDGIYFWETKTGLCYYDLDGWRHTAVPTGKIECVDLLPLPGDYMDVKDICVNKDGTCSFYDSSTRTIRILKKA